MKNILFLLISFLLASYMAHIGVGKTVKLADYSVTPTPDKNSRVAHNTTSSSLTSLPTPTPYEVTQATTGSLKAIVLPSQEEVAQKIRSVFGDAGEMAVAIARCESGLRPNATGYNSNSIDQGVFQINSIHQAKYAGEDIYNLDVNLRVAYQIFKASGWGAWTTYHNGCYQHFLVQN